MQGLINAVLHTLPSVPLKRSSLGTERELGSDAGGDGFESMGNPSSEFLYGFVIRPP